MADEKKPDNPESFEESGEAIPPVTKPVLTPTRILLRGVAVSLPTILTVVVLIWVLNFVNEYIISPATWTVKWTMANFVDESRLVESETAPLLRLESPPPLDYCDTGYLVTPELRDRYRRFLEEQRSVRSRANGASPSELETNFVSQQQRRLDWMQLEAERVGSQVFVQMGPRAVPYAVYAVVAREFPPNQMPTSARAVYMEYVAQRYFGSLFHLSLLTVLLIVSVLYFTGQFVSARLGNWMVRVTEEQVLGRLPVIRNIYGSVKQVTDFLLTENQQIEYRRVAAVQYTRKGVWAIGFVTGESLLQISVNAGEPCLAVFVPTSPMPMTGFTINVPRSEVIDLDLSVEQAMQFCISCGVLSPPHQKMTPQKFKEFVERGLIRASISAPPYMPSRSAFPPQTFIVPPREDEESDEE